MFKYPRTLHLLGSRFQKGDHDLEAVSFSILKGKTLVVEEKMDGANTGISFEDGALKLQSRGHYLRGGPREEQFDLLKVWATTHVLNLRELLGDKYVMFGEWMYAKHTCFYDNLPHYFMEFDILDKESGTYLSTLERQKLIEAAGMKDRISSVAVLETRAYDDISELEALISRSLFKTEAWEHSLEQVAKQCQVENVQAHTDMSSLMEGLYVKWEEGGEVKGRYKYVRQDFTNAILDQGEHWMDRTIVPNVLQPGANDAMFT